MFVQILEESAKSHLSRHGVVKYEVLVVFDVQISGVGSVTEAERISQLRVIKGSRVLDSSFGCRMKYLPDLEQAKRLPVHIH